MDEYSKTETVKSKRILFQWGKVNIDLVKEYLRIEKINKDYFLYIRISGGYY